LARKYSGLRNLTFKVVLIGIVWNELSNVMGNLFAKRQVGDWQSVLEEIFARPLRTYGISDKLVRSFKRILTTSMFILGETIVCGNLFIASEKWESTNDCLFSWIASVFYYFFCLQIKRYISSLSSLSSL